MNRVKLLHMFILAAMTTIASFVATEFSSTLHELGYLVAFMLAFFILWLEEYLEARHERHLAKLKAKK